MSAGTRERASASTAPVRDAIHMRRTMHAGGAAVAHEVGAPVRRLDRAHQRASYASGQTPSKTLAALFGISESRVRHQRTDDRSGALTLVCEAVANPDVDGAAIVAVILEAFQDRFLTADVTTLRARLDYLRSEAEHMAEARQNRALQIEGEDYTDEVRDHAETLIEIAALKTRLG